MKSNIAIYLQHYLSPSMTFIYRQLLGIRKSFKVFVLSSHKVENLETFPFEPVYFKSRNFKRFKAGKIFTKIYGQHKLLSRNPRLSFNQKKFFSGIISDKNIQLIHAHFVPAGIEILPVVKKLNIPLVVNFHGYDGSILLKFRDYREKLKELFNEAYILLPSFFMLNELNERIGTLKNYSVLHIGIPVNEFGFVERKPVQSKYEKNEKIIFLQVANFVEKKGHFFTVSAFNDFLKYYENAELILAGDGQLKDEIQRLVDKLDIINKVKFFGTVTQKQVIELMGKADVFLHHSVTSNAGDKEGIPTVLMEAMATGLPCISTIHAGITELIKDGINGFLVEERDVESYVQKMIELVSTSYNFSYEARNTIESDFNLDLQNEKLIKVYNSLMNS
ncbi:GDP-mannose-dependent alpha-(1-6)-phosphatidylinositol monomannoside mannosyltransferase [bacterium BMS3Abin03]|nr:GDP-mannose-dependent alpha-(1-6)-phosphatidylinositol monomannoside mannosyltransferase [bacterium BMS3Abin03]